MLKQLLPVLGLALAFTAPAMADSTEWSIDGKHSSANFAVRHMMISNVRGAFSGIKGTADFDGKNIKGLSINADIDATTVDTGDSSRDQHLRGADFFNVEKFPVIAFKSKRVTEDSPGKFKLIGDLTMHGVTKEVALTVDGPTPVIKDPQGNEKVGASASAKISRKDFGIEYNKVLDNGGVAISDDVDITIDLELSRKGQQKKASN